MDGRPRRQEQEPAISEVTEVAPGILRAQLPIDMPGLGHTNCYVIEDERGVAVVDPGLPGRATLKTLEDRLASVGVPLARIHTVVVTHSHPDHFGGAGWIRRQTGAEIVTHRAFRFIWDQLDPPDVDVEDVADAADTGHAGVDGRRNPWDPPPWGGAGYDFPLGRRLRMRGMRRFPRFFRTPTPTTRLDDADVIRLGRREWVAVHTPGHTEDHLCLYDPTEQVLLSGDHVLPTITPHIGGLNPVGNPLDQFFASLQKVADLGPDVSVVLPAHGHPFDDLAGRATSIRGHHLERLDMLRRAVTDIGRPATVQELSSHLFSARAQGPMADSETFAHLEHLRYAGEFERFERPGRWEYARSA
jgi:glyoxylase-like metal-dependent hydrolase (beta-lactamase superfamily II)